MNSFFRQFILISGILCSCSVLWAKSDLYIEDPQVFTGGLVGGLNLAQVDGDLYFGYKKPGIVGGCFVNIFFSKHISTEVDMLYNQKGSRGDAYIESPYAGPYVAKCHIGLNYVELPVTIRYQFAHFYAEAGLSYARLIKTNEWITVIPSVPVNEYDNRFNNTEIGYVFGLGSKVSKNLLLNIRYQYSATSIRPADRVPQGYAYGTKGQFNNLFCVRIMYEF